MTLSDEDDEKFTKEMNELVYQRTEANNLKQTFDPHKEKDKIKETEVEVKRLDAEIKALQEKKEALIKQHKHNVESDTAYQKEYADKLAALEAKYA